MAGKSNLRTFFLSAWSFDKLRKTGTDIVLIPSYSLNVSKRSTEPWVDSLKALAKWFEMYVVAPDDRFKCHAHPSFGHVLIICPNRAFH